MSIAKKDLKLIFPNLIDEIENQTNFSIELVTQMSKQEDKTTSKTFSGYNPDIIDFIRRCDTEDEAVEIIRYMEKKLEISKEYATNLIKEIKVKGVRSFGPKKEIDYYSKSSSF